MMKKKFLIIALVVCMLFAGCGSQTDNNPTDKPANNNNNTDSKFTFVYNNVKMVPNQLVDSIIAALGNDYTYLESPSCAYVGLDKVYAYKGFTIYTYPDSKSADHISQIVITDDSVSTPEGIRIGDAAEKIAETYGRDYQDLNGAYVYTRGKTKLGFVIKDGKVFSIQYDMIEQ